MQPSMPIVRVGPEDLPRLLEVWEASVRATHDFLDVADIAFYRPLVEAGLPLVPHLVGVRDGAGRIAAFMAVDGDKIEALFVHPDHRGQGIGRQLVAHAVEKLAARRVDVNEQNEQAVGFYHRVGFRVVRRSPLDDMGRPFPILHMEL